MDSKLAELLEGVFPGLDNIETAAADGRLEDVKSLLAASPSLVSLAVPTAIVHGHLDIAQYCITQQGCVIMGDAVYAAIQTGSLDAISLLLEYGWDVNAPCASGQPALCYAVPNKPMVEYLLAGGADPNIAHFIDSTPLSAAVKAGEKCIVEIMFNNGGDSKRGQLFHHAVDCKEGDLEILELLFAKGAPVDEIQFAGNQLSLQFMQDFPRGTPLHVASMRGNFDAMKFLLEKGANPDQQDTRGRTAYQLARDYNQTDICVFLRHYRESVERRTKL